MTPSIKKLIMKTDENTIAQKMFDGFAAQSSLEDDLFDLGVPF